MYFSVITPNQTNHAELRNAAHELARSRAKYGEHQWLWNFFPSAEDQKRDFIFRRHELNNEPRFYVVSERQPVTPSPAWEVKSQPYQPQLSEDQCLAFQLCANPVVAIKSASGKSKRHDVVMHAKKMLLAERGLGDDAQWKQLAAGENKLPLYDLVHETCLAWLKTRGAGNGFEIISAGVDAYTQNKTNKPKSKESAIQFSTVDFSGDLRITDVELFKKVLFTGLGHAKGFGCGLLLVKKRAGD